MKVGGAVFFQNFKYGGMPLEEAQCNVRLFAQKVLPVIQAEDASNDYQAAASAR